MVKGRVICIVGNRFHVETADGMLDCGITNSIRRSKSGANKPAAVGDDVEVEASDNGEGTLLKTLPRRTKLCRAKGGSGKIESVLVANADRVLAAFASRGPDPDYRLLDRALVMAEAGRMEAALVMNKSDLGPTPPEVEVYRKIGYRVFETSAATGAGIEELGKWLTGGTTVLMGQSGVGKSSLLNAVTPGWVLKTGELSRKIQEGRHTTTWVEMLPLPGGGWVVDTPGIETFGLWGIEIADLAGYYPDIRPHTASCKFRDCSHDAEPGCAVKAAVEAGKISAGRYEGFRLTLKDLREGSGPGWRAERG